MGAIPAGWLIGRLWTGRDVRKYGSGNTGATNILRVAGPVPAAMVVILDVGKGALAAYAGVTLGRSDLAGAVAALAVLAGNMWPVFLRFRGGRGVAHGAGAFLYLAPPVVAAALAVFALAIALTRYVSLGSILAAVAVPLLMALTGRPSALVVAAVIAGALVIWRHRPNIRRLLAGQESRLGERVKLERRQ